MVVNSVAVMWVGNGFNLKLCSSTGFVLRCFFLLSLMLGLFIAEGMDVSQLWKKYCGSTSFGVWQYRQLHFQNWETSWSSLVALFLLSCPSGTKLNKCKKMNSKKMSGPNCITAERSPALLGAVAAPDLFPYQ